jgi:hypothetical protein
LFFKPFIGQRIESSSANSSRFACNIKVCFCCQSECLPAPNVLSFVCNVYLLSNVLSFFPKCYPSHYFYVFLPFCRNQSIYLSPFLSPSPSFLHPDFNPFLSIVKPLTVFLSLFLPSFLSFILSLSLPSISRSKLFNFSPFFFPSFSVCLSLCLCLSVSLSLSLSLFLYLNWSGANVKRVP